jgi:hypothetical protein
MTSRRKRLQAVVGFFAALSTLVGGLHGRVAVAEGDTSAQVSDVYFGDSEGAACQPGSKIFSIDNLRSLYVCIVWTGVSGTHAAQLRFTSPDGNAYQTMTLAFVTPGASVTASTLAVDGHEYPVTPAGWGRAGETLLVASLPVAGTYITQHNLAGDWKVQISLDGRTVDEDRFTLRVRKK